MWKYFTKENMEEYLLSNQLIDSKKKKDSLKRLYSISNNIHNNYKIFWIPKRDGTKRMIEEPLKNLKWIQKKIMQNILNERKISPYAKAFQNGISLKENVSIHMNKEIILKLDIKDFFHSITSSMVYEIVFLPSIYPEPIRVLLTNLCTLDNKLPQGSPTSPKISNLILRDFDYEVAHFCDLLQVDYTRYADDLTFSGSFNPKEIIHFVRKELQKRHFCLNEKKIRILKSHNRQVVTGIVINEKMNVSKKYRREIRQKMYYIKKYGIESFYQYQKKEKSFITKEQLLGKINFVLQITPDNLEFQKYRDFLKNKF